MTSTNLVTSGLIPEVAKAIECRRLFTQNSCTGSYTHIPEELGRFLRRDRVDVAAATEFETAESYEMWHEAQIPMVVFVILVVLFHRCCLKHVVIWWKLECGFKFLQSEPQQLGHG